MNIENVLARIGIEGKLAKFYLAALALGEATVHEVAQKAGVTRTNAYDLLDGLLRAKLVSRLEKSGKYFVVAEDPKVLIRLTQDRLRDIELILPILRSTYNGSATKPRIHFYEGIEGIQNILSDTLECRDRSLSAVLTMMNLFGLPGREYMEKYIATRIAKGISLRVVRAPSEEARENIWATNAEEARELRYAPTGINFSMNLILYDDKVAIMSSIREDFGMIIESQEFHHLMDSLFTVLWHASSASE